MRLAGRGESALGRERVPTDAQPRSRRPAGRKSGRQTRRMDSAAPEHFLRYFDGVVRQYPGARLSPAWRSLERVTRDWSTFAKAGAASQGDVDRLFDRLRRSAPSATIWEPIWQGIAGWARQLGLLTPDLTRSEYAALQRGEAFRTTSHRWLTPHQRPFDRDVGHGLQEARERAGLTRGEIADVLGVPHQEVKNVEWGLARADEARVLQTLHACGADVDFRPRRAQGDSLLSIVRRRDRPG